MYLEGVDEGVEVTEGEAVITSGLGGGYFRGLVIGTVSKVEQRQGDATRTIVIIPNASFDNISEVLVVLGMSNNGAADENQSTANAIISAVGPDALLGNTSGNTTSNTDQTQNDSDGSGESSDSGSDTSTNSNEGSE